jgi:hypothetical protein
MYINIGVHMSLEVNGIQNYNYFQPKPVDERNASPVWGGDNNFFVHPPVGYTEYVPQDLFSGNTVGLSGLVANSPDGHIQQNLAAQAGYGAGVSTRSFVA